MSKITNLSDQAISIPGLDGVNYFLTPRLMRQDNEDVVDPRSEADVPKKVAARWAGQRLNTQAIAAGRVTIDHNGVEPAAVEPQGVEVEVAGIDTITDPDVLESMFAEATDPDVLAALEQRMEEIG